MKSVTNRPLLSSRAEPAGKPVLLTPPTTASLFRRGGTQVSEVTIFAKIGLLLLLVDILFTVSRLVEFWPVKLGPLSLAVALRCLVLIFAIGSGELLRAMRSKTSFFVLAFAIWILAAIPFSSWKGGSVELVSRNLLPAIIAFVAANTLFFSLDAVRKGLVAFAFSGVVIILLSQMYGEAKSLNRLEVGAGSLGNANDLAIMSLLCLPCVILYFLDRHHHWAPVRILMLLAVIALLGIVAKTGSRSGLLTLMFLAVASFWSVSGIQKLLFAALGVIGLIAFLSFAPASSIARYKTVLPFLSGQSEEEDLTKIEESADASSEGRWELLKHSLELTVKNPLFGVGPGTYESAADSDYKQKGLRSTWHATHNTYTQISSECGIPGFIFFVGAIISCFKAVFRVRRRCSAVPELVLVRRMANCILTMLACFTFAGFFSGMAYLPLFPLIAALADAFQRHAMPLLQTHQPTALPSSPLVGVRPGFALR